MTQATEVLIETSQRIVIHQVNETLRYWCEACAAMSNWLPVEKTGCDAGAHQFQAADGKRYRCLNSGAAPQSDQRDQRDQRDASFINQSCLNQSCPDAAQTTVSSLSEATAEQPPAQNSPSQHRVAGPWELHAEAFNILLAQFDANWERAGEKYLFIRQQLVRFFESRSCASPANLADETINRVARRLAGGVEINHANPLAYFYGVARYIWREDCANRTRQPLPLDQLTPTQHPCADPQQMQAQTAARHQRERLLECLEQCLRELPGETRQLFLDYHRGEKRARIERRQQLARQLGITPNALKIRMSRLRGKLERGVNERLAQLPPVEGPY